MVEVWLKVEELRKFLVFPSEYEMARFIVGNSIYIVKSKWVKMSNLEPTLAQCWVHLHYLRKVAKGAGECLFIDQFHEMSNLKN